MSGPKRKDIKGIRYGNLIVVSYYNSVSSGGTKWLCICDCGRQTIWAAADLKRRSKPKCKSCASKLSALKRTKHGKSIRSLISGSTYSSYQSMIQRCENPNSPVYKYYGGRGIKIDHEWRKSFQSFYNHLGDRPKGKTLDRINVNGNYEPGNCRWATTKEQSDNKRKTK